MKSKWFEITRNESGYFELYFGVPLSFYFDGLLGFDLIKFERLFNIPDNISMGDYIKSMYGKRELELIEKLISI